MKDEKILNLSRKYKGILKSKKQSEKNVKYFQYVQGEKTQTKNQNFHPQKANFFLNHKK